MEGWILTSMQPEVHEHRNLLRVTVAAVGVRRGVDAQFSSTTVVASRQQPPRATYILRSIPFMSDGADVIDL